MIHVCSLADMPNCVAQLRPSHLVSLLTPDELPDTPQGLPPERHLRIGVSDIVEPLPGHILPDEGHIEALIAFADGWQRTTPLLVHCYAGVSRSMAAALILLALEAKGREAEVVALLADVAPHAWPNPRMIQIADRLLGRRGRLSAAVEAMTPRQFGALGPLVTLPARLPAATGGCS